jgi:hypothetical protein
VESTYPNFPTGKLAQPWLTHDVKPRNMVYALQLGTSDATWWQIFRNGVSPASASIDAHGHFIKKRLICFTSDKHHKQGNS